MQTETPTVNKGFMCEVCGKVFAVKYSVARHFNSVHLKKRMYCPFCKKGFKQKSHLKKHMLQSCKMKSDDFVWNDGSDIILSFLVVLRKKMEQPVQCSDVFNCF